MNFRRILVPVDLPLVSRTALYHAAELAREHRARLYLLHVSQVSPLFLKGAGSYADYDRDLVHDAEALKAIRPSDPAVEVEHYHRTGSPAQTIVEFADRYRVDLIVMHTHGRSGIPRWVLGSTAEAVLRNASCPVLLLRDRMRSPAAAATKSAIRSDLIQDGYRPPAGTRS